MNFTSYVIFIRASVYVWLNLGKKLLGAKGIATRNKRTLLGAPGRTTRSKKLLGTSASLLVTSALLLGAPGSATRNPGIATNGAKKRAQVLPCRP